MRRLPSIYCKHSRVETRWPFRPELSRQKGHDQSVWAVTCASATSLPPDPEVCNTASFGGRPRRHGSATVTSWSRSTCAAWAGQLIPSPGGCQRRCQTFWVLLWWPWTGRPLYGRLTNTNLLSLDWWRDGCRGRGVMWHRYQVELADFCAELAQKSCRRSCVRGCADEIARYKKQCTINQLCRRGF